MEVMLEDPRFWGTEYHWFENAHFQSETYLIHGGHFNLASDSKMVMYMLDARTMPDIDHILPK